MEFIKSLFTYVSDYLNGTSWFGLIQWPMLTLTAILAFFGVYTAQHGKGKLLCVSFQTVIKLVLVYMVAATGYIWFPQHMAYLSQLPFFSASETTLSLVNPIGLGGQSLAALFHATARLYFLFFCISVAGVSDYPTKSFLSWAAFQALFIGLAVGAYAGLSYLLRRIFREGIYLFCGCVVILLLVIYGLLFCGKTYFTFTNKNNSENFQNFNKFFTEIKFGTLFTIAAISTLIAAIYIVIVTLTGHNRLEISSVNPIAFVINFLMCSGTLYIFNHYYVK